MSIEEESQVYDNFTKHLINLKMFTLRKVKENKGEISENDLKTINEIFKIYVDSIGYPKWVYQRNWEEIKEKFTTFLKMFYPKIEIWQNEDHLVPDIETLGKMLESRLKTNKTLTKEIHEELLDLLGSIRQEAKKQHPYITDFQRNYSQYLCSVDLEGMAGDTAHIWRNGVVWWPISGDYDIRDEELIGILARSFIIKNIIR